jgi:transposase
MRGPATIKEWMTEKELQNWIREAADQKDYQKRLAIWLTVTGPFHAYQVATMLGISKQAVWLWISQYNKGGPSGLHREGRGGRRWAFLTLEEETKVLGLLSAKAINGEITKAKQILPEINRLLKKEVSLAYVYKLLKRHRWRKLDPRPRHIKADIEKQEDFKKNSHHCLRK